MSQSLPNRVDGSLRWVLRTKVARGLEDLWPASCRREELFLADKSWFYVLLVCRAVIISLSTTIHSEKECWIGAKLDQVIVQNSSIQTMSRQVENIPPWKISPLKIVTPKNIDPWKIFTPEKYSLLKIFTPGKYSLLENIHPEKIFTPEKYSALIKHKTGLCLCYHKKTANIIFVCVSLSLYLSFCK